MQLHPYSQVPKDALVTQVFLDLLGLLKMELQAFKDFKVFKEKRVFLVIQVMAFQGLLDKLEETVYSAQEESLEVLDVEEDKVTFKSNKAAIPVESYRSLYTSFHFKY